MGTESGNKSLLYYYNPENGGLEIWTGREPVNGMITTDSIDCANDSATTITTISSGKKAYVTGLFLYNSDGSAQEFTLVDGSTDTKLVTYLDANEAKFINSEKYPLMVLDEGDVTGQAGSANYVKVTMTYFEE
ncbi:MAG: hypothetical protein ACOCQD_00035 [archaeon]